VNEKYGTGRPHRRMLPDFGLICPIRLLNRVDLPLPFTPTSAQVVPPCSVKLTSRMAVWPLL